MAHMHHYRPRGSAAAIFADRSDEILVSGPAGTGKSRACLEKINAAMVKYSGAKALLLRKTAVSLGGAALATWRQHVVNYLLADQGGSGELDYYGGSAQEPPQYRYTNGSRVMFGGLDNPTKIMSTEYDLIYVQEATELTTTDWEFGTSRLRNGRMPYQQMIADCNPDAPTHWLKLRCDCGTTKLYNSRHEENPVLFDDRGHVTEVGRSYIRKLDALTGVRYHRLRKGLWVAAEGVIYADWDPTVHVVEPYEIPDEWPRYWSVDFGFVNPFVLQMWAEKPDGQYVLYREWYTTDLTVDQHATAIMEYVSRPDPDWRPPADPDYKRKAHEGRIWTEPRPRAIICDHDAEGRRTLALELNIGTKAADKKNVKEGIESVQRLLRPRRDGKPGFVIFNNATIKKDPLLVDKLKPTSTVDEIPSYVWDIRVTPKGETSKDEPVKENDHGADALRYFIKYVDKSGRPNLRV